MSTHNYLDKTGLGQVWSKIKDLIPESDLIVDFYSTTGIGAAIVGTTIVGDDVIATNTLYVDIYSTYENDALIYFSYYDYFGQANLNSDNSFSAICFKSKD